MSAVVEPTAVVVRRDIPASAEILFDAWLDPESMAVWMRPATGFGRSKVVVDARVGGAFEISMQGPTQAVVHTGIYRSIDRPNKLAFTWHSVHTGANETLVTVEFKKSARGTEVVITHEFLPDGAKNGHQNGWTEILANFAEQFKAAP